MLHPTPTSAPIPIQRNTLPFLWQKASPDSIGFALHSCAGFAKPVKFVGSEVVIQVVVEVVVVRLVVGTAAVVRAVVVEVDVVCGALVVDAVYGVGGGVYTVGSGVGMLSLLRRVHPYN